MITWKFSYIYYIKKCTQHKSIPISPLDESNNFPTNQLGWEWDQVVCVFITAVDTLVASRVVPSGDDASEIFC